jgi:hypothetical protein
VDAHVLTKQAEKGLKKRGLPTRKLMVAVFWDKKIANGVIHAKSDHNNFRSVL